MKYPEYYDNIEHIVLKDELSEFLGSSEDGIIDISYLEIVKMAGHSCAVVSGAYLMALKGLKALYGNELPQRGNIRVELRGTLEDNTGVFAQVFSNITGATSDTGFLGVKGRFNRRGLLSYGTDIESFVRLTRLDNGKSVNLDYVPGKVVNPGAILQPVLADEASEEIKKSFPRRWQEMVKTIFENADVVVEIK